MSYEKLMTANEVKDIFGIELQRVWELTRRKLLPTVKLGDRQYRYSRQAIERFIADGGNTDNEVSENEK